MEGTKVKNVSILDSSYNYTYSDAKRGGLLFCTQNKLNENNPAIFENLKIQNVKCNSFLKRMVGSGYAKLTNSKVQLKGEKLIDDGVILDNTEILYVE